MVSIDVGCGGKKKAGTIGLDVLALPGVDHVVDFAAGRLPFDDGAVGSIFSSHCLEHVADPMHLFREIVRVARDGAPFEIWVPYAFSSTGFLIGHVSFFTERQFEDIAREEAWREAIGARFAVKDIVLAVDGEVQRDLERRGVDLEFAVRHYVNVVAEMGIFGAIEKSNANRSADPPRRFVAPNRDVDQRRPLAADRRSLIARARAAVDVLSGRRG